MKLREGGDQKEGRSWKGLERFPVRDSNDNNLSLLAEECRIVSACALVHVKSFIIAFAAQLDTRVYY